MNAFPFGQHNPPIEQGDHHGLHYEKLTPKFANDGAGQKSKAEWRRSIASATPAGDPAARLFALLTATFPGAHETGVFALTQPLAIGLGIDHPLDLGCLWHPTLGFPYIPGSGLKGLCLSFARDWLEIPSADLIAIFGRDIHAPDTADAAGSVIFFDAMPCPGAKLRVEIFAPHHSAAAASGAYKTDTEQPIPVSYLAVESGSRFRIAIARRPNAPAAAPPLDAAWNWLVAALDLLGAGAKTARAHGRMTLAP